MPKPKPSGYQQAVVDWVTTARGNAFVGAVAGSGKTTLLEMVAAVLSCRALFLAFSTTIKEELDSRLRGTRAQVRTVHSAGYAGIRAMYPRTRMNNNKYFGICKALFYDAVDRYRVGTTEIAPAVAKVLKENYPVATLKKLVEKVRVNLVDPNDREAVQRVADHYNMVSIDQAVWPFYLAAVPEAIRVGNDMAAVEVDFTDMIYLPATRPDIAKMMQKYPFVLIDEAQDLSRAQMEVALACVGLGGRVLAVGDKNQAIFGFSGADCKSVDRVIEKLNAKTLPLSICYRCPKKAVELAKEIVPQIEAAPNAIDGVVETIPLDGIDARLQEGDLVICRTNAPIIKLCYSLIKQGVPARVRGRDIGKGLQTIAKKVADVDGFNFGDFGWFADKWLQSEVEGILRGNGGNEDDMRIASVQDRVDCVRALCGQNGVKSMSDLIETVEAMFSDDTASIYLSSIHRAKGLEANRVFWLAPELVPHPMAVKDWEVDQEWNIRYVALTRCKRALYFVVDGYVGSTKPSDGGGNNGSTKPSSPKAEEPVVARNVEAVQLDMFPSRNDVLDVLKNLHQYLPDKYTTSSCKA